MKVTLIQFIKTYLLALTSLLLLDAIWLPMTNKHLYRPVINAVTQRNPKVRWIGGLVAWKLLALIISVYAIWQTYGVKGAVIGGLLMGLAIYGVFNGTNYAIFPDWTLKVSLYDTVWGSLLCCFVTLVISYYLNKNNISSIVNETTTR